MGKAAVWRLHLLVFFSCSIISVPAAQYQVSVISEGPSLVHSIMLLVCTIHPAPPGPIEFMWRTTNSNHSATESLNTSHSNLTLYIPMTHPTVGRYFCHVRSGDITLGVGAATIEVQGLILPVHMSVPFSRPDRIDLQVKVSPTHVFTETTNLTFAWYHNNCDLSALSHNTGSGVIFNESESSCIVIDSSVYRNAAGTYEARLKKLAFERPTYPAGSLQIIKKPRYLGCSKIALQALKNYAILRPAIFHVAESGTNLLREHGRDTMVDSTMVVQQDSSVFISVVVNLSKINRVDFRKISSLHYKWSLNGVGILDQHVQVGSTSLDCGNKKRVTQTKVSRRNVDMYQSSFILLNTNVANVTLSFPQATTQDAGIYELQVFMNTSDLPFWFLNSCNCRDYVNFLSSSKGLKINNILLGSSAVELLVYDAPKVSVVADQVNAEMGGAASLTCSVLDNNEVSVQHNMSWVKNGDVIMASTGNTLTANTSHLLDNGTSHFGTYSCVESSQFGTAVKTIHIAEEVDTQIQLRLIEPNNCTVWENSSETLDAILQDVSNTVSMVCGCNVTTGNFLRPSLRCFSNNVITLMSTFAYANSEGTVLASSVIESTNEWMKGSRRVNQTVYQLSTNCPMIITAESEMDECTTQQENVIEMSVGTLVVVILGSFFVGLLTGPIVIGTIFWSLKCRRKPTKQQEETQSPTPAAHKQTSVSTGPVTQSSHQTNCAEPRPYLLRQRSETHMADNLAYGCRSEPEESYSVVYDYPSMITASYPEEDTHNDSADIYEKIND